MAEKQRGRIIRSLSGFYDVRLPDQVVTCRGRGILRKEQITPLTGDLVEITLEGATSRGKTAARKAKPAAWNWAAA